MPTGVRLRNVPVRVLSASMQERWQQQMLARRYTQDVLARAVIRAVERDIERRQPQSTQAGHDAALLANRNRRQRDMTRLRLFSGEEVAIEVPEEASLHDFYIQVRNTLGLQKHISLALLRVGPGGFDNRLLSCSRRVNAWRFVKKTVFEVVMHK